MKKKKNMKGVYKFQMDYGRSGFVEGIFVEDSERVENIIGRNVYFGEILGKHSEVQETMVEDYFILITDDQKVVSDFEKYGFASGIDPFYYLDEQEHNEYEDEDIADEIID